MKESEGIKDLILFKKNLTMLSFIPSDSFIPNAESNIMLKKILIYYYFLGLTNQLIAQVTAAQTLFQYSIMSVQPTELPYHYLEQFDDYQQDTQNIKAAFKGCYLNIGSRGEQHAQTGTALSSVCAIDKIAEPQRLKLQMGGGVMYHDLEALQIAAPFAHVSTGKKLNANWHLLGGLGYQFAAQRLNLNRLTFKDLDDPKIAIASERAQRQVHTWSVSTAITHLQKGYIGIGYQRSFENNPYVSAENKPFSELNLVIEYAFKFKLNEYQDWHEPTRYGSTWVKNPNRGFHSNVHLSMAMRYLMSAAGTYPLHAQFHARASLTRLLWAGLGWNTANRVQMQLGLLKIPVFKTEMAHSEYQIWVGYDLPNAVSPRHGAELHLGYAF
jgi:hypothetical protein